MKAILVLFVFIQCTSSYGQKLIWAHQSVGLSNDVFFKCSPGPNDYIYAAGITNADPLDPEERVDKTGILMECLNTEGEFQWRKVFMPDREVHSIKHFIILNERLILTASTKASYNKTSSDYFYAFDLKGNLLWKKRAGLEVHRLIKVSENSFAFTHHEAKSDLNFTITNYLGNEEFSKDLLPYERYKRHSYDNYLSINPFNGKINLVCKFYDTTREKFIGSYDYALREIDPIDFTIKTYPFIFSKSPEINVIRKSAVNSLFQISEDEIAVIINKNFKSYQGILNKATVEEFEFIKLKQAFNPIDVKRFNNMIYSSNNSMEITEDGERSFQTYLVLDSGPKNTKVLFKFPASNANEKILSITDNQMNIAYAKSNSIVRFEINFK